jgi:hypothetical protein
MTMIREFVTWGVILIKRGQKCLLRLAIRFFLKPQPYVQSSLAPCAHQKLAFKYFGSYMIIDKIGHVAYKLKLPDACSIHPIFHVCHLKKMVSPNRAVASTLPHNSFVHQFPEAVLDTHMLRRGNAVTLLVSL